MNFINTITAGTMENPLWRYYPGLLVALFGFGVYIFANGLIKLKDKRLIQNIPTSKIATAAMGTNVEIHGHPTSSSIITAPISGEPCIFFTLSIQVYKYPYLKTEVDQICCPPQLEIQDEHGSTAQINTQGVRFFNKREPHSFDIKIFPRVLVPDSITEVLLKNRDQVKNSPLEDLLNGEFEWDHYFVENYIRPMEPIYALGYATTAQDGRTLLIQKGETGDFIISNKKESALTREWKYDTPFQIFGGAFIAIASMGLFYLYHS